MAETWEVILFVIVAILIFIIIVVVGAAIWACMKKRNRRKARSRSKGLEWGKGEKNDYGEKNVKYNVKRGDVEILDERDSGGRKQREKKVKYNASTEQVNISDVDDVDSGIRTAGQQWNQSKKKNILNEKNNNTSFAFNEKLQPSRTKVTKAFSESTSKHNSSATESHVSQKNTRERLEPLRSIPLTSLHRSTIPNNLRFVNSYSNMGFTEANTVNGSYQSPTVQFQQPVAVVHAIVHPRQRPRAKSLTRNASQLSHKKTRSSFNTRRKSLSYRWSLEAKNAGTPSSWITVPVRCRVGHQRRSLRRHGSADVRYSSVPRDSELEWDSDYKRWKYARRLPQKLTRHSSMRRRLRREKRLEPSSRWPDITGTSAKSYELRRIKQKDRSSEEKQEQGTKARYHSTASDPSVSKQSDRPDYYSREYTMVERSEFPEERPASRILEPDMISIASSDVSSYVMGPPRPTDSYSGDQEGWQGRMAGGERDEAIYTRGSYKDYSNRKSYDTNVREEYERNEQEGSDDHKKHSKLFQDTLENLNNGGHSSPDEDETSEEKPIESPWHKNDSNFRKKHGVPISGVAVLPPQPVFVQTAQTDSSDEKVRHD